MEQMVLDYADFVELAARKKQKEYTGVGANAHTRFEMILQCAFHLNLHIGQIMYLGFELKRGS